MYNNAVRCCQHDPNNPVVKVTIPEDDKAQVPESKRAEAITNSTIRSANRRVTFSKQASVNDKYNKDPFPFHLNTLIEYNEEIFVPPPTLICMNQLPAQIFQMIKLKDYNGVSATLAERGYEVEIVPKIGCSKAHYTKMNIANIKNKEGDPVLIAATKTSFRMVEIVLKYGADPNATNRKGDRPLSIAAARVDRDSIDALLHAGANLNAAVTKLTSDLGNSTDADVQQAESGFSVNSLSFLLSNDVYLKCRDPFTASFEVSKSIEEIVKVRSEFKMAFELLIRDADVFAYKMLDQCEKMWETKEVLDKSHGILKKAIDEGKKRFVGHPFSQQIILEEWYGNEAYKSTWDKVKIAAKYILSPILLPWYLIKFLFVEKIMKIPPRLSRGVQHIHFLFIPFICFLTDILNYLILLGLLIATCLCPKESHIPSNTEIALWFCTISRLLIEIDQLLEQELWRYLANMWNITELFSSVLISAAAVYRMIVYFTYEGNEEDDLIELNNLHKDILKITYMYALTEFIMILRWLNFLEFFPGLGPVLIALRTLITEVFRFVLVVLFTCVMGTAIAVHSVVNTVRSQNKTISDRQGWDANSTLTKAGVKPKEISSFFNDFGTCIINVMWSTFGIFGEIKVENDSMTTNVVYVMLLLYIILAVVLMLNMLIAILNNTFERIQGNCDIEWKYARSQLLKEYRNGQPFVFPFHIVLIPVTIWYRYEIQKLVTFRQSTLSQNLEEQENRDKLFCTLCDRYRRSTAASEMCGMNVEYLERDDRTFANAIAIQRHKSFTIEARRSVHRKLKRQNASYDLNSLKRGNAISVDPKNPSDQSADHGEKISNGDIILNVLYS